MLQTAIKFFDQNHQQVLGLSSNPKSSCLAGPACLLGDYRSPLKAKLAPAYCGTWALL